MKNKILFSSSSWISALKKLRRETSENFELKEDKENKVTSFCKAPCDKHYPSEKLVKSYIDKQILRIDTFSKSLINIVSAKPKDKPSNPCLRIDRLNNKLYVWSMDGWRKCELSIEGDIDPTWEPEATPDPSDEPTLGPEDGGGGTTPIPTIPPVTQQGTMTLTDNGVSPLREITMMQMYNSTQDIQWTKTTVELSSSPFVFKLMPIATKYVKLYVEGEFTNNFIGVFDNKRGMVIEAMNGIVKIPWNSNTNDREGDLIIIWNDGNEDPTGESPTPGQTPDPSSEPTLGPEDGDGETTPIPTIPPVAQQGTMTLTDNGVLPLREITMMQMYNSTQDIQWTKTTVELSSSPFVFKLMPIATKYVKLYVEGEFTNNFIGVFDNKRGIVIEPLNGIVKIPWYSNTNDREDDLIIIWNDGNEDPTSQGPTPEQTPDPSIEPAPTLTI